MSKAEDIGAVSEVDRLIGAVGAGMLDWSETAARMRILAEALRFYATPENYEEQAINEGGRTYYTCPIEEDDRGIMARVALSKVGNGC